MPRYPPSLFTAIDPKMLYSGQQMLEILRHIKIL
jgi:hypothetical protein